MSLGFEIAGYHIDLDVNKDEGPARPTPTPTPTPSRVSNVEEHQFVPVGKSTF